MLFLTGASGTPATGYQISRSLRFNDDDSAYLNRTPAGAGNRKTWTWSGWVKRGNLGSAQYLFSAGTASTAYTAIFFDSSGKLNCIRVVSSATDAQKVSTAVFRDPSAWYHIVVTMDAANTTLTLYVNGSAITALDTNDNPSNVDGQENAAVLHEIGRRSYTPTSTYFDGYLTEVHFVDGSALTPSSFGETDATTGVWKPKRATGITYGTNGFYLSFADNTSTTTLGYDDAGGAAGSGAGSNDWTLNNFSVTAGAGNDSLVDTPTNNYCTCNPVYAGAAGFSNGSLDLAGPGSATYRSAYGTMPVSSGKWYWEVTINTHNTDSAVGMLNSSNSTYALYLSTGNKTNGSSTAYGSTYTSAAVIGVALDLENGKIFFSKNGTWQASGEPAAGTNPAYSGLSGIHVAQSYVYNTGSQTYNFGQRPFAYTPPTGYSALCTSNLPTPTIRKPSQYFNAVTYTGTGSSLGVTGVGHQPDLVWIKSRSAATDHALYDAVRGVQARLESNQTDAEATTDAGLTAFGSDGFTVNTLAQVNTNTATYVGWCWREGVTPGVDIVSYTGDNTSNRNINHSLGAAPHFAIIKDRSNAEDWFVYHRSLSGATSFLKLNATDAQSTTNTPWGTGNWSSTQFMVTNNATNNANANSANLIAYLFTEISGFSRFGSYTGNGSADGPFVWTGFRPRYVLIKRTDSATTWVVMDAARNPGGNTANLRLYPASTVTEETKTYLDLLANGFKIRVDATESTMNTNTGTYIFAAFSEAAFKYALAR